MEDKVFKRLIESKDPESTYKYMLDLKPSLSSIPNIMTKVRNLFREDESNRRAGYQDDLMDLIQGLPRDHADRAFLMNHLGSNLAEQEKQRRKQLTDAETHQKWKALKLYDDWFYDWATPDDVKRKVATKQADSKETKELDAPVIPKKERREWYDVAIGVLEALLKRVADPRLGPNGLVAALNEALLALCLMTGRRPEELVGETRTELTRVEGHPLQLRASRLAKKRGSEVPHVFPVLIDASIIITALRVIRSTPLKRKGMEAEYLNASRSTTRNSYMTKLFGEKASYTTIRGVYTRLAFEDRKKSGFYPNAGFDKFVQKALGHTTVATGQPYRNINED